MRWTVQMLWERPALAAAGVLAVAGLATPLFMALGSQMSSRGGERMEDALAASPELARSLPEALLQRARELGVMEAVCHGASSWVQVTLKDGRAREAGALCGSLDSSRQQRDEIQWRIAFGAPAQLPHVHARLADSSTPDAAARLTEQLEVMLDAVQRGKESEAQLREWREQPRVSTGAAR